MTTGRVGEVTRHSFSGSVRTGLSPAVTACEGVEQTLEVDTGGNTEVLAEGARPHQLIPYMSELNIGRFYWG